ncbi:hypothetical protein Q8F55_004431 [Vanrija albida]|uniref:DUF427 domain-containing protein n=1 Tax=Vanrija albida TaxID=181172 RepID=A0ABR3Q701_9TREE
MPPLRTILEARNLDVLRPYCRKAFLDDKGRKALVVDRLLANPLAVPAAVRQEADDIDAILASLPIREGRALLPTPDQSPSACTVPASTSNASYAMTIDITTSAIPSFAGEIDTKIPAPITESGILKPRIETANPAFTFQPTSRRVRGVVGDTAVVDSRHHLLVWEPHNKLPDYSFPSAHVRTELLTPRADAAPPTTHPFGRPRWPEVQWFDLTLGDRKIEHAAWKWNVPGLEDYITFHWLKGKVDKWFEEDELVFDAATLPFNHPRDPFARIDVIPSSRHVKVLDTAGNLLADSTNGLFLYETTLPPRIYLPKADVKFENLADVELTTTCPYKGPTGGYWSAKAVSAKPIAWSYTEPSLNVSKIKDHVAFFNEHVKIFVDGVEYVDSPKVWA